MRSFDTYCMFPECVRISFFIYVSHSAQTGKGTDTAGEKLGHPTQKPMVYKFNGGLPVIFPKIMSNEQVPIFRIQSAEVLYR